MHKRFTKICTLVLGLTMAIGVGVAIGSNSKALETRADTIGNWVQVTSTSEIAAGDKIVLVTEYSSTKYYMNNSVNKGHFQAGTFTSSITNTTNGVITLESTGTANRYKLNSRGSTGYVTSSAAKSGSGQFSASDSSGWDFSVSDSGDWDIIYNTNSTYLRAYQNSFRTYSGRSNNACLIYKYSVSYTLQFNANGGSGTVPSNITGSGTKTLPSSASLTKTGYTLDGWGDSSHKDAASAQYALGASYTLNADATLYAHWTANKYSVSASITYGGFTGATGANAATYGVAYNATITANTNYTLPTSLTVTMGGSPTNAYSYNSGTGAFSIASPTGNISISGECVPDGGTEYVFSYELSHCSITNAPESMYDNQIKELQIVPDEHYKLPAEDANKVSVTGAVDWYYDEDDGTITIDGAEDDLTVTVECVAKAQNTISMGTLTGVSQASGNPNSVEEGASVTLTFVANEGYGLPTNSGVTVSGTGSSFTWTQGTGKLQITGGTGNITVSITGIVRSVTSISLSSNSGSYELGDTFVMPTVTANYNVGASEDVTSQATATGDGLENGILTKAGTKTITISYGGQSATYTATVTAITPSTAKFTKVESGTVASGKYLIVNETASAAFNGGINSTTYDTTSNIVSVAISNNEIAYSAAMDAATFTYDSSAGTLRSAAGYYIYRNGTSAGVTAQTSVPSLTTSITISNGNAVISNEKDSSTMRLRYNNASGQDRFRYYNSDSVQPIQIYKYQAATVKALKWITAEVNSGTYYQGSTVTASNFTVTAHYNDGSTPTVTSDITVTNGYLANVGANSVTLTYGGKSCTVSVTAVEQTATLTGLTWAQGEYTIIDGQTIDFSKLGTVTATYDVGGSTTKAIGSCTVSTYTKTNDTYTKVADISNGATITSTSHGKYLGVSYTEKGVTKVAYSSAPIYVVEAIEDVYTQIPSYTWSKVTAISVGDVVTFVSEGETKYKSASYDSSKHVITAESYTSSSPTDVVSFTVGSDGNGDYTLHNDDGYLMYNKRTTSGGNELYFTDDIDDTDYTTSWGISFDGDGNAIIQSIYSLGDSDSTNDRTIQYNYNNGLPRFSCYRTVQTAIQLYKGTAGYSPSGDSFANTNVAVQKAVLEFAKHFNDTMNCVNAGSTSNVSGKWSDLAEDFDDLLDSFYDSETDLAHCKALFANAYSVDGGDTLQDMLARYDYIVAKYKLGDSDFLHSGADRAAVKYANISPISFVFDNVTNTNNTLLIIISIVSLTAIGGYFFIRSRREH